MQKAMPDRHQIHIFAIADGFLEAAADPTQKEKMKTAPGTEAIRAEDAVLIYRKKPYIREQKRRFPFDDLCTGAAGSKRRRLGVIEVSMRMADIFP